MGGKLRLPFESDFEKHLRSVNMEVLVLVMCCDT